MENDKLIEALLGCMGRTDEQIKAQTAENADLRAQLAEKDKQLAVDCIHDIWSGIRAPTCAAGYMHCDPMTCIAYRHQTEAEDNWNRREP